jgi:uncharacterized protein (TIGR02145 family)
MQIPGPGVNTYSAGSSFTITKNVTFYAWWIVADADGNVYDTVRIGNQTWLKQNLRTTRYRNKQSIVHINGSSGWDTITTTPAYCWYNDGTNNDDHINYGALYNFYAVADTRNLAPVGWRVATEADFDALNNYINGSGGTGNPSEFATFLGGYCIGAAGMYFLNLNTAGYWWSSHFNTGSGTSAVSLHLDGGLYMVYNDFVSYGYSVRCVKDTP